MAQLGGTELGPGRAGAPAGPRPGLGRAGGSIGVCPQALRPPPPRDRRCCSRDRGRRPPRPSGEPRLGRHRPRRALAAKRDGRALVAGNDASFAAIAEARRGAAVGAGSVLHLYMDAGIGGAVIEGGRLVLGATGTAGEFGHMPFGDPAQQCRCGARGCWDTTLDGAALARALKQPQPADEVSYVRQVLAAARAAPVAPHEEVAAAQQMASSAGRGVAGLVNAFDPDIVTFGGLGASCSKSPVTTSTRPTSPASCTSAFPRPAARPRPFRRRRPPGRRHRGSLLRVPHRRGHAFVVTPQATVSRPMNGRAHETAENTGHLRQRKS